MQTLAPLQLVKLGTLQSDNGDANKTSLKNRLSSLSNFFAPIPSYLKEGNLAAAEERGQRRSSDNDGRVYCLAVPVLKTFAGTAKQFTKMRDARAQLLLCFLTFPLPSPS